MSFFRRLIEAISICNYIDLNKSSRSKYIVNLGIVNRVNKNSFIYQKVLDEMMFPLHNLGYSKTRSIIRIKEVLEMFKVTNYLDKNILLLTLP